MVDWQGRLHEKEPTEGMSGDEIVAAFDRLIVNQERRAGKR